MWLTREGLISQPSSILTVLALVATPNPLLKPHFNSLVGKLRAVVVFILLVRPFLFAIPTQLVWYQEVMFGHKKNDNSPITTLLFCCSFVTIMFR